MSCSNNSQKFTFGNPAKFGLDPDFSVKQKISVQIQQYTVVHKNFTLFIIAIILSTVSRKQSQQVTNS